MAERNPNLMSPKAMEAMASTANTGKECLVKSLPKSITQKINLKR